VSDRTTPDHVVVVEAILAKLGEARADLDSEVAWIDSDAWDEVCAIIRGAT